MFKIVVVPVLVSVNRTSFLLSILFISISAKLVSHSYLDNLKLLMCFNAAGICMKLKRMLSLSS